MQGYGIIIIALVVSIALIPVVLIAKSRAKHSDQTRIHLILDMDNQPRYKEQTFNPMFADRRAMRPRIPGTVRREINLDEEILNTGRENGDWTNEIPLPITDTFLARGQQRFEIYCAACHGLSGYGDGIISQRAELLQEGTWTPPLSFHIDQIRQRPNGHLFNTITNGIRNMPPYGSQIVPEDRWAIVTYIRALQLSQNATMEDIPADRRTDFQQ